MSEAVAARSPGGSGPRGRRTAISVALHLGVLALVVWFLLRPQIGSRQEALALLATVKVPWLLGAVAAEVASLAAYTVLTYRLLAPSTRPRYGVVARVDFAAIGLGKCLPDGGAAGTALSVSLLAREGVPAADATVAKVVQGLGSAVVVQSMVFVGLGSAVALGLGSTWASPMLIVAGCFLLAAALISLGLTRPRLWSWLERAAGRVPRFGERLVALLRGLRDGSGLAHLRAVAGTPTLLVELVAYSLANWAFDALALWLALESFNADVGIRAILVAYAAQALGTWIPLTPGGLGVAESIMIPAIVAYGATRPAAVDGILSWRLLSYWIPIVLGAGSYLSLTARRRRTNG